MSAVRWLNHNWKERQPYMLDVIKCVRFGLMTPWQLLELKRNGDCPEIQKIVDVPEVKRMVDDGLSFVTTKYWYDSKNLSHYMKRYNLVEPVDRQWVRDKTWTDQFDCPNKYYSSYKSFLDYLDQIRHVGTNHWKKLQVTEQSPNAVLEKYIRENYN